MTITLTRSKSELAAKKILKILLALSPDDRLDALALACNAWIEEPKISGISWADAYDRSGRVM